MSQCVVYIRAIVVIRMYSHFFDQCYREKLSCFSLVSPAVLLHFRFVDLLKLLFSLSVLVNFLLCVDCLMWNEIWLCSFCLPAGMKKRTNKRIVSDIFLFRCFFSVPLSVYVFLVHCPNIERSISSDKFIYFFGQCVQTTKQHSTKQLNLNHFWVWNLNIYRKIDISYVNRNPGAFKFLIVVVVVVFYRSKQYRYHSYFCHAIAKEKTKVKIYKIIMNYIDVD